MFRSLKPMPRSPSSPQQRGMSDALARRASKVYSSSLPPALSASGQAASSGGDRAPSAPAGCSVSCRLPSFFISVAFSSTSDQLALADDADAVRHLLRLVDVVRGQDDGHAARRAGAARAPTCPGAARRPRPAVGSSRNRISGSCASAFAIITRRFMPPGERHDLGLSLVPQRQVAQHASRRSAGFGRAAEQPAAEADRRPDASRTRRWSAPAARGRSSSAPPGSRARCRARPTSTVPRRRRDDAADDVDERRLPGAVRPEQREDLALPDLEIDRS